MVPHPGVTVSGLRGSMRQLSGLAESPLKRILGSSEGFRTGHHQSFAMKPGVDRSAPRKFRESVRKGEFKGQTSGSVPGFVQANFVALPREHAYEFLTFCLKNPAPCPLLAVTEPGSTAVEAVAAGADISRDIPRYVIHRDGKPREQLYDVAEYWNKDMVGFLLGCSFSWEDKLASVQLTPKNAQLGVNVSMYNTNIPNHQSGPFKGNMVVSMRPYKPEDIERVAKITEAFPGAHGGPVHWGDPKEIGIDDISSPNYGDAVPIEPEEIPVFWACGVTPQSALRSAELPIAITHAPGHMFITDIKDEELEILR